MTCDEEIKMNNLNLTTDMGKYEIVLRDLDNGNILVNIIERFKIGVIEEALDLARKYNPKHLYLITPYEVSEYKEHSNNLLYHFDYELTKSYKEIKMNLVEASNRGDLLSLINKNLSIDYLNAPIDNFDIMDFIKKKNAYYFTYKHNNVGCIITDGDMINYLILDKSIRNSDVELWCISKALYFYAKSFDIIVNSKNIHLIELLKNIGFKFQNVKDFAYEVK